MNYWTESAAVETSVTSASSTTEFPMSMLKLWLRADAGIVRQTTNQSVAIWLTQVGTNDASQMIFNANHPIGPNQPGYVSVETNGHPTVEFNIATNGNGTNDFLHFENGVNYKLLGPTNETELYVVHQAAITSSATQGFWDFGTEVSHKTRYADQNTNIVDGWGCNKLFIRSLTNTTVNIGQYHLYRVVSKTNDWKSFLNGTLFATNTINCTPAFPGTPALGRSTNDLGTGHVFFSGNIAEVLIFSPPLTNNATNTVHGYLTNKYNIR